MGQGFSTSIEFKDNYSASTVTSTQRIKSISTCTFTQLSSQEFSTARESSVTCKFHKSQGHTAGFGLVPVDQGQTPANNFVGDEEIRGSIGCRVTNDTVMLMTGGNVFFAGSFTAGATFTITMHIRHGRLTFFVNQGKVNSDELKEMSFHGQYKLGVSMTKSGQQAEVFFDSPVTFKDCWTVGDVSREMLVSKGSLPFTFYSEQVLSPGGSYVVTANVLQNRGDAVGLGTLPTDCQEMCRRGVVGLSPRSTMGCILKAGNIVIFCNEEAIFQSKVNTRDPCVMTMKVDKGAVTFYFDGKELDCDKLKALRITGDFRVGVSLTEKNQLVEMRGDGQLPPAENDSGSGNGWDLLVNAFANALVEVAKASNSPPSSPNTSQSPTRSPSRPMNREPYVQTSPGTVVTAASTVTHTSEKSFDEAIMDCFIDSSDLHYGGKKLGQGTFGRVYRGTWDGYDVAIKELLWEESDVQRREIAVGRSLAQPNIAQIMGWSRKDDSLLVVMPLFKRGSLEDRFKKLQPNTTPSPLTGGPFGFDFAFCITIGMMRALKYMADRKPNAVIHRDIKPENVLLDDNDQPKLTDFGIARSLQSTFASTMGFQGTPLYMAPEQSLQQGVSTASDLYAAALVGYETLCAPRRARDRSVPAGQFYKNIEEGRLPPMHDLPGPIAAPLRRALSVNPGDRPSPSQMINELEVAKARLTTSASY